MVSTFLKVTVKMTLKMKSIFHIVLFILLVKVHVTLVFEWMKY